MIFDKTYNVGANNSLRVKLLYQADDVLDMDVISSGNLEFGYEDEDELTFYPNTMSLEFDDFEKKNYLILKHAFGLTGSNNYENNHSGEIYFNQNLVFSGYIDKKTLTYDDNTRRIFFELVDYSVLLRQKPVPTSPQDWAGGITDIIEIYKQVYPNLDRTNVTQDISEYTSNTFNGVYFRHNWQFRGNGSIGVPEFDVSWSAPEGWKHVHIYREKIYENSDVFSDVIKNYAREFGMSIGSGGINKLYITKRFINSANFPVVLLQDVKSYRREVWLNNIIGVRNIPKNNPEPPTNIVVEGLYPTLNNQGDPVNKDDILDMQTILTRQQALNNEGAPNIRVSQGAYAQTVLNGIIDPDLVPLAYMPIERIITRHYYLARRKPRDKYEIELNGINYRMNEYYKLELPDELPVITRPIQISIDLIRQKTEMQALEAAII